MTLRNVQPNYYRCSKILQRQIPCFKLNQSILADFCEITVFANITNSYNILDNFSCIFYS